MWITEKNDLYDKIDIFWLIQHWYFAFYFLNVVDCGFIGVKLGKYLLNLIDNFNFFCGINVILVGVPTTYFLVENSNFIYKVILFCVELVEWLTEMKFFAIIN